MKTTSELFIHTQRKSSLVISLKLLIHHLFNNVNSFFQYFTDLFNPTHLLGNSQNCNIYSFKKSIYTWQMIIKRRLLKKAYPKNNLQHGKCSK